VFKLSIVDSSPMAPFFTLTSFRCTGNSLLWRAIGANMLDCCGGLFISDIFEPNKRNFYYFNSVYIAHFNSSLHA
jgi:hypothetical protein